MEEAVEEAGLDMGAPMTDLEETSNTISSLATPYLKMREGIFIQRSESYMVTQQALFSTHKKQPTVWHPTELPDRV